MPPSSPTLSFKTPAAFRHWLEKNHAKSDGIWLRYFRKSSPEKSITYAEALDQALCFAWIDGQAKPFDDQSWLQRYTPRRARSSWSQRNTTHIARLTQAGLMTPAGIAAVEAAKADGRWHSAYASPRNAAPPDDFLESLAKNRKAKAFFATLNKANIYSIVYRLETAKKPETRASRMTKILTMLAEGKSFHPQAKPARASKS